jgi:hypothetical protein
MVRKLPGRGPFPPDAAVYQAGFDDDFCQSGRDISQGLAACQGQRLDTIGKVCGARRVALPGKATAAR